MALISTRHSIMRWILSQCANQKAIFHHPSTAPKKDSLFKTFRTCSRRNCNPGDSRWDNKQLEALRKARPHLHHVTGLALGLVGVIAGWFAYLNYKRPISTSSSAVCAAFDRDDLSSSNSLSKRFNFVADVVEKAAPSVVFIEVIDRHPFSGRMLPVSNGSGFVVHSDGVIITNAHVVANKTVVRVRLYNGKEMEGWVIAVDPVSDLAAIKVDATGLPALKMGMSTKLRAGEWVIAMGSPLSLSNSVTCGIVSSVNRGSKELGIKNKDMEYIQTDALINFGNSGGPLVNLDGDVIGINAMKVTPGISFAIPADYATSFLTKVHDVLQRGQPKRRQWLNMGSDSSRRRFIGITMLTLNNQLLMELKSRVPDFPDLTSGVLVHKIVIGSPAYNGGLQAGDIITEINKQIVQSSADIYRLVESSETLRIIAFRGNHKLTCTVTSEEVK